MYKLTLKEFPKELQPRERLISYGVETLSERELLAILLTTGSRDYTALELADQILSQFKGLKGLVNVSIEEVSTIKGIGSGKGARILAALEIGKRISLKRVEYRPAIRSPEDVSNLLMEEMRYFDREHFKCLLLNTKNQVLSIETISIGGLNSSLVHPREVFKLAIKRSAQSLILVHNHPSGDPTPSPEDIRVTRRLCEAGKLLGIEVLDHVIIGDKIYFSMKEKEII